MRTHRSSLGALVASTGLLGLLAGLSTCAEDPPKSKTQSLPAPPGAPDDTAARALLAATPLGSVVLRDTRGTGRFVVGTVGADLPPLDLSAESAARLHLERHASLLGLSRAALRDAVVTGSHSFLGGARVVQFGQRLNGIEVFHARASVVVDAGRHLVSIASGLPSASRVPKLDSFRLSPEGALTKAYAAHFGATLSPNAVHDEGPRGSDSRAYAVVTPFGAPRVLEATAKRVLFPEGDAFVPGYHIELVARLAGSNENAAYALVAAANDGHTLYESSLTENDAFTYRVWAEPTGNHVPTDGPMADYTPSPSGVPDKAMPDYVPPTLVTMDGFNKNPQGAADPWLAASDTFTFGNNVRAYSDRDNYTDDAGVLHNDGYDAAAGDIRADITSAKTFDRIYDVKKPPEASSDQIKAAITQLFYVTNWLHDYWYDSGFNEASGNAQLSNYGRGGVEGDPLRAEAQDGADFGQSNNANMSTPSDGMAPRMQMFVWTGMPNRTLTTTPALTFTDGLGASGFGPQTFDLSGTLVLSDDGSTAVVPPSTGTGTTSDACQLPTNVSGKIAVVDRGSCAFTLKVKNAQTAGAIGVLIVNNAPGHAPPSPGGTDATITIPLLGLSLEDGQPLKQAPASGAVSAHMVRGAEVKHDGTIDNTVVAHEWGHYLHHRLVLCGGPSCGGMSEGWADFDALMMVIRDGDTFDNKTYALSQYATAGLNQNGAYFGIRRAPYSIDMAKNPFTFQHVRKASMLPTTAPLAPASTDMSEVHNVGEIWAQTLFEGYVNLINAGKAATPARTFDESKRRMADYIVAGMKATPTEPTFVEQRDALLSTVLATGRMDDFAALAQGFAKRGLGSGATAPPPFSMTLNESVENFAVKGNLALVDTKVDDSTRSCDRDGNLDAGESGKLTVRIRNAGWAKLTKTEVKVSSTDDSVTFDKGGTATIASLDPYGVATVSIGVSAKDGVTKLATLPITVTLSDPDAVAPTVDVPFPARFNFDDKPGSSSSDDVESSAPVWKVGHGAIRVPDVWSREGDGSNHIWHADDLATTSDESLVSPDLVVGQSPFVIAFSHRFSFEKGPAVPGGPDVFFDGGVLEVSEDGGTTWNDVSTYTDPGYPLTLYQPTDEPSTNVLAGRKAWGGDSAGYPNYLDAAVNLGTKLAGKTVKVRFRIGTDPGGSAAGWDIDNVSFSGITNTPFPSLVDDEATCNDAGADGGIDSAANDGAANDAAVHDSGNDGAGSGGASDASAPNGSSDDSGCSCSVIGGRTGRGTMSLGLIGALLMALRRKRRTR